MERREYHPDISVGGRIKQVRQAKGLTQKEFADSLGIVQGFLSGIERGRKVPSDTLLIALSHFYGINEEWLLSGKGEMFRKERQAGPFPAGPGAAVAPVLRHIGEGFPSKVDEDDILQYISLPDIPEGSYALQAYGDFMAPTIRDGDMVIFRPGDEIGNGVIVLVTNRWGEPILRRYRTKDGEVFLSPDNATYAPFKPDPDTRTIGVVIDVWRKIKV